MSNKKWMILFTAFTLGIFVMLGITVIIIDPYFHYHKPISEFYYSLDDERTQNDGIMRHFDYQGLITGTSIAENFKTSEAEKLFKVKFIKVPFCGGRFKEINDRIKVALDTHKNLKYIIRSVDTYMINIDKDAFYADPDQLPEYLYDKNTFNDIEYLLNKDVIFKRNPQIIVQWMKGGEKGITSFDEYVNWVSEYTYGAASFLQKTDLFERPTSLKEITDSDRLRVQENIKQNVVSLPMLYPDVEFYYFFPPYSAAYWGQVWEDGELEKMLEVQSLAIEEMLKYPNIKIYGFDNCMDVTADLNNYRDKIHYHEDVNSWMLEQMHQGNGLLTEDNYQEYLEEVESFYSTFDFNSLFDQIQE